MIIALNLFFFFLFLGRRVFTNGVNLTRGGQIESLSCFETNIDFEIRFMADHDLVGCSWITLPSKKYRLVTGKEMISRCQFEVCFCSIFLKTKKTSRYLLVIAKDFVIPKSLSFHYIPLDFSTLLYTSAH